MPAGPLPPPPPRNTSATGTSSRRCRRRPRPRTNTSSPTASAAQGLRPRRPGLPDFLRKHPKDHLAPDAQYWLGESLYQQQNYDDAARSFLAVSTKYKHFSKAPDALLRLGQSLAALHHKEAACATSSEVKNKFPHASSSVKRGVARELKRVHC